MALRRWRNSTVALLRRYGKAVREIASFGRRLPSWSIDTPMLPVAPRRRHGSWEHLKPACAFASNGRRDSRLEATFVTCVLIRRRPSWSRRRRASNRCGLRWATATTATSTTTSRQDSAWRRANGACVPSQTGSRVLRRWFLLTVALERSATDAPILLGMWPQASGARFSSSMTTRPLQAQSVPCWRERVSGSQLLGLEGRGFVRWRRSTPLVCFSTTGLEISTACLGCARCVSSATDARTTWWSGLQTGTWILPVRSVRWEQHM